MDTFQPMSSVVLFMQFATPIFLTLCLYFVLTFFQALKREDEIRVKKAKIGAVLTLALALMMPYFFNILFMWR